MINSLRRTALALALLMAPSVAFAAPPPKKPKLIVAISVDQFSLDLFQRYRSTYTGGMKRLAEGLVFTGYHSHAATETCPGHSVILTGDHPSRTGIVANNWYDRKTGANVYCVSKLGDPSAKTSALLKVDTLGDWLRAASPASRSYAVSGKDRAAIMMGGHHPTGVYWWDDGLGFRTSKYAGPVTPAILAPARAFNTALMAKWKAAPPVLWPATVTARCEALEKPFTFGKLELSGKIPPDSAKSVTAGADRMADHAFHEELRASPIFDPLALGFAESLIAAKKLGHGRATDLLAVSLSATDHIGHRFGPGGAEMCVQMAALDAAMGEFLQRLDVLKTPYVVMLTADHGGTDAAERLSPPGKRLDVRAVTAGLEADLRKTFALDYDPTVGDDPRQVILKLNPADEARRPEIVKATVVWLSQRPEVSHVFTADEIAAATPPAGARPETLTIAQRFHESFDPDRSGDVIISYLEGASLGIPKPPRGNVAGHGSPFDSDRRVPILFWWPGVKATTEAAAIETVDIAPTLAAVAGLKAPDVDGRCVEIGQGCPAPAAPRARTPRPR